MVTLELHQLDLAYASLRITDPARGRRLEQSIAQQGQQAPGLVVEAGVGRFRLIEGYGRVEALRRLDRDTVSAIVLDVPHRERGAANRFHAARIMPIA